MWLGMREEVVMLVGVARYEGGGGDDRDMEYG